MTTAAPPPADASPTNPFAALAAAGRRRGWLIFLYTTHTGDETTL